MNKHSPPLFFYKPFLNFRAKFLGKLISPYIPKNCTVLDVGCGNMLVSKYLNKFNKSLPTGLDVINMNLTNLPHKIYNGKNIPYPDKSFDVSLLMGVLHHCQNPESLLLETKRATKQKIVLFEDVYFNPLEKIWVKIRDITGNIPEEPHMNFSLKFHDTKEWEQIFKRSNLNISYRQIIFLSHRLTHHALYILDV